MCGRIRKPQAASRKPQAVRSQGPFMHLGHSHPSSSVSALGADARRPDGRLRAFRVGLGGPVGSGKTATVAALCRVLRDELSLGVVTNDIYTREDAEFLLREAVLPPERIVAVETGACPHTAIRDDISANLEAVEDLEDEAGPLDLVLVESGGDNLTATFSKGLVDAQIFVIDVAGGDDIPRKGGPGVTTADLLVVNKTDLAPYVGSDLGRMAADARTARGERPVVLQSLRSEAGVTDVAEWVRARLAAWTATG
jgi:urease accessory protein